MNFKRENEKRLSNVVTLPFAQCKRKRIYCLTNVRTYRIIIIARDKANNGNGFWRLKNCIILKLKNTIKERWRKILTEKRRRTSNPRNKNIGIRVTSDEKQAIEELASRLGLTLTDTIIEGLKALDEKYKLLKK